MDRADLIQSTNTPFTNIEEKATIKINGKKT